MPTPQPAIEIVYFDAGGGHRSAALALRTALIENGHENVELLQLQSLLKDLDPAYRLTGLPSEQVYNAALKRGWTYGSRPFLRLLQRGISFEAPAIKRRLLQWWSDRKPRLVVSVIPNFNRVLFEALRELHPATPFVTVMTDFSDSSPHFWMEDQDQFLICGTRKATLQAVLSGCYRPERVFEVSGMILHPRFYAARGASPKLSRQSLGLGPASTAAVVSFGGSGSEESIEVVEELRRLNLECIVLCGRNAKLVDKLAGRPGVSAVAFTDHVEDYLRLADFLVGKPGPGSISEALLLGLPAIVMSNARTMIQERYNVTWLEEQGVGIGIPSLAHLSRAVRYLLEPRTFAAYRARAARIENRAVFEISGILGDILAGSAERSARAGVPCQSAPAASTAVIGGSRSIAPIGYGA